MTPYSHVEVHVHQPEQRADLTLRYLPQPILFRAKQTFVAFAVAGNGSSLGSQAALISPAPLLAQNFSI